MRNMLSPPLKWRATFTPSLGDGLEQSFSPLWNSGQVMADLDLKGIGKGGAGLEPRIQGAATGGFSH
jgi:hypothetical protein